MNMSLVHMCQFLWGWSFSMCVPQLKSVYVAVQQGTRIPSAPGGLWEVSSLAWGTDQTLQLRIPPPQNVIFYKYYTFKTGSGAVGPSYSKCTLWASNTLYRNLIKSLGQALLDLVNQNLHFNKAPGDSYSQSMRRTSLEHTEVGQLCFRVWLPSIPLTPNFPKMWNQQVLLLTLSKIFLLFHILAMPWYSRSFKVLPSCHQV